MKRILPMLLLLMMAAAACRPVQPSQPAAGATPATGTIPPAATVTAPTGAAPTGAAPLAVEPLPADPDLRVGKLENGLTYYIRKNGEPPDRAELWLAVNAGSVLETDDQQGLAHFLEHMLFNGTEKYPGAKLIDFLESIGMRFGPDVNASTSWDETVYTLQVPTDDQAKLRQALEILSEWANKATIAQADVDKERGVIVEEWRYRDLNAEGRVTDALVDTLLKGSQYAERLPIGDMNIVRNAPAETLRSFYTQWYRPDNMAVIAVGDFANLDQVEQWIRDEFASVPKPQTALERPTFPAPDYEVTNAHVITDPETTSTFAYVAYRQPAVPITTTVEYRTRLMDYLAAGMLNQRYAEITRKADAPFLAASAGRETLVRPVELSTLVVQTDAAGALPGLEAALTEVERARQHGFTVAELERAKADLLRQFQRNYDERNKLDSSAHAQSFLDNFLTGATPTSPTDDWALAQKLLPTITLDEINGHVQELYPAQNRAVVLIAPAKQDVALPDAATLAATLDKVATVQVDPYLESAVTAALLATPPTGSPITAEETFTDTGITHLTLANGVQVYLKPTDFKDDQVVLASFSPGGSSVVTDTDVPEAALAARIIAESGVGQFSRSDLDKILAGKAVSVSPFIDELSQGFSGSASPQDLETLFQLIYLYSTQPRLDKDAFDNFQRQVEDYLQNRSLAPESALQDKRTEIFCGDNVRCNDVKLLSQVGELDLDRALELYKQRMAQLGDSKFMIVGAFDPAKVKQLAQTYLGALPATPKSDTWRDVRPKLPQGVIEATVNKGIDPRSSVEIIYSGPFTPTVESRAALRMVTDVLDIMLREDLREQRSGTYGAGVTPSIEAIPAGQYEVDISFTTEPTRVDELVGAVFTQVQNLRDNGPSAENFAKAQEQELRTQELNLQRNEAWLAWMGRYLTGDEGALSDILHINDAIKNMTAADIQAMAQQVLPDADHVTLILHPENFKQ